MLTERLTADMKTALKAGEKERLGVIRMLLSELKNARIANGGDLDETAEQRVLGSYAKKRLEAIESARAGGRDDIAAREKLEYDAVMAYLPERLGEDELRAIVKKQIAETGVTGPQAFGVVMKAVIAEVAGRADGKAVSAMVKELIAS